MEAINAAGAAGATRCRVLCPLGGRGVGSCPWGSPVPGGLTAAPSPWRYFVPVRCGAPRAHGASSPGYGQGRQEREARDPPGTRTDPACPPRCRRPEPRLCPAGSPGGPEVPPAGSSAISRLWSGRGAAAAAPGAAMANHLRFVGRTVMVQSGNVEAAYGVLNRILAQDGVAEAVRRSRYYEKPSRARRRRAFEACRRVYCTEMARKIAFLARSSRQDPWLGC
ncbi:small ribosomal subunit protein bS21m isoform 2-T2 [Cyanocitta cristata]